MEYAYSGKENAITAKKLKEGLTCKLTGYGNSMTPKIKSGQSVIVVPVKEDTILKKKDVVFVKVNGHYYLHMISAINGKSYQISNNHGHVNGTVGKNCIYGKMVEILS